MIEIRKVKINETIKLKIINMQNICLPEDEPIEPTECTKEDKNWWWIGTEGYKPVCFANLKQSFQWLDTVYLARSGVLPKWRGQGLQKKMITIREKFAKKLGYNWVITDTTDNLPSSNSLISKGYKMFYPSNPWGNSNSLYWRKKL
tara:strand:+ start:580 stop:1017 length:438 start_codon:yes stop_codon:yes gene_type:complete